MKPLTSLLDGEAGRLRGLVFDLDDTLLDHGALTEIAYGALFRLREAGLLLVACTGRPAGWADVIARQWPIDAAIAENGAIGFRREGKRILRLDRASHGERADRTERIRSAARALTSRYPELLPADDNGARITDLTFDIGELEKVPREVVELARSQAHALGVRTFVSSVHMHLTLETYDKASGTVDLLARHHVLDHLGDAAPLDETAITSAFAYVGDSENDAAAFAAFKTTFGVANVAERAHLFSKPPRYVASAPRGRGFAEIAARLLELRGRRAVSL